ncbi:MAG TPA: arginine deiminase-related protein, partial [Kofleriaceae bacterium]|nr:arginine deiminase-related protein [Kofleriaceae bacterium]
CAQYAALLRTVRSLGAQIELLPFVHGAFDSVFAKDNALYTRENNLVHALFARPRHAERQREQAARAAELEQRGVVVTTEAAAFEGGDVIVVPGRCVLLGHGFRSRRDAAPILERCLDLPVIALELVDPALYHLDTALAVLADGTALVCDEAFAPAARATLRSLGLGDVISVPRDEAMRFALNLVEIGDAIVTGTSSSVNALLASRGKHVRYTPLDEFQRAGGSAACLLAHVHDHATVATRATTAMRSTAA